MLNSKTPVLSRIGVAVLALGLAGSLAACGSKSSGDATPAATPSVAASASTTPSAAATPTVKPTIVKSIDEITVAPVAVGAAPKVTGKWPLAIAKTEVKVLTPGTGAVVAKGATVKVNYEGFNARTGKGFDGSFTDAYGHKEPATFPLTDVVPGFTKAIEGQKIGSRVVVFMTSTDGYADGQPSAGIEKGDNLVFVIDILGQNQPMPQTDATLPKVSDDAQGLPTVVVPKTAAPTAARSALVTKGMGAAVTAKDAISYSYRAWDWATGQLLEDSAVNASGQTPQADVAALPAAMQKAIIGQPAGSRVLIVLTPADLDAAAKAAGGSTATPSAKNTKTLVYVIDVLQAQAKA